MLPGRDELPGLFEPEQRDALVCFEIVGILGDETLDVVNRHRCDDAGIVQRFSGDLVCLREVLQQRADRRSLLAELDPRRGRPL